MTRKQSLGKVVSRFCRYPVGQKFRRNSKEIQDGRKNLFWGKVPRRV